LAAGIWGWVVQGSIGGFLASLASTIFCFAGIRYIMGAFVAISDVAVAMGHWPHKVEQSVDRSAVAHARWHIGGRSNCGQLLGGDGAVLLTFDPLISKGQSRMIAELLGVPFVAPDAWGSSKRRGRREATSHKQQGE
jgi:hypothetical protein